MVIQVERGSIGEEVGIEPGDCLIAVNGKKVEDVFDYRYLIQEDYIELEMEDGQGEPYVAEIEKDPQEDLGLVFEDGLMDGARSCSNRCIFCFIDQLPPHMRKTLYFKDDDSRLSFLQGNYVTLTNMKSRDLDRIIYYHLSPINISVHTTDLDLRARMLKNKNAANLLDYMTRLAKAHITMHLQVVLCKGVNDGAVLDKTIEDCTRFYPYVQSMSVVPVGLSGHRENLYPLEPFSREEAAQVVRQIESWQKKCLETFGSRFVFAADELYLQSGIAYPPAESYEAFYQYENGVGMLALLEEEFLEALDEFEGEAPSCQVSLATGEAAYAFLWGLCQKAMERFPSLQIKVYEIKNHFFGGYITVSGLLTGRDILAQLREKPLGSRLLLPDSLLRNGTQTLLDDYEISDLERELHVPIVTVPNSGKALLSSLLDREVTA